jgi:hypothetical protein
MSVDISKRIYYTDASNGMNIPTPASLRDEKWATVSCPFAWSVKGFWLTQPEGAEPHTAQKSWGGSLAAVGNSSGNIYLAHNPCPGRAGFVEASGHAGAVKQLAWIAGDTNLISCGIDDHTLLQWKCIFDTAREVRNPCAHSLIIVIVFFLVGR